MPLDAVFPASGSSEVVAPQGAPTVDLELLCRTHANEIYVAALRAGFSRLDAEDAMQDAFEALVRHQAHTSDDDRESWIPPTEIQHPVAWMKKVAFRAALRKKKASGIYGLVDFMSIPPELAIEDPTVELHSQIAARELLAEAAKTFPQGAIYAQYMADGFTAREIAEKFGVSEATVRYNVSKVRARMRRSLLDEAGTQDVAVSEPDQGKKNAREVLDAIEQLPNRQRQVLSLTLDGLPPRKIAAVVGIKAECVRVNLHHAKKRVAGILSIPIADVLTQLLQIKNVTHRLAS